MPRGVPLVAKPMAARWWPKVAVRGPNECWEWQGSMFKDGYGRLTPPWDRTKRVRAHRVSWALANDCEPPEGMVICHRCDNKRRVNPAHLFLGTQGDNIRDAAARGRLFKWNKTHCLRGHEFTEENTYRNGVVRVCRACRAIHQKASRAKARGDA